MIEDKPARALPRLQRYLLLCLAGCVVVIVLVYTQLLEYYLELGIEIRTQRLLEQTAEEYAALGADKAARPALPSKPGLSGYHNLSDIPPHILGVFALEDLKHGEAIRFTNMSFGEEAEKQFVVETHDLCQGGNCELLFLYSYRFADEAWLYLLHGIIGSDEIYEELEFTERFATPIAILSSNVELLDRLSDRPERTEAEQAAFLRQYRALDEVQLLMETLLWVNRQSDNLPKFEQIDLRRELDCIVENYSYLLEERNISLTVTGSGEATAPVAAVRIVLSNLVRNAFQYTMDGEVRIAIGPREISVENSCSMHDNIQPDDEYGFGLGLELVGLICQRFAWRYSSFEASRVRTTTVYL